MFFFGKQHSYPCIDPPIMAQIDPRTRDFFPTPTRLDDLIPS
jgi:hypothetical protein